ncbi:xanthine dehydrogenase family protein molybdopterin-binding subunit [Amycolatopsis sp. Hca4]|uniref:xanthine dehydrogenase family protein molybdopterin-binding subunit n=1 Tax=Amycolatopsis sp. Hca4 TaxID=2742131 RepID=UPI00158FF70A|nr:xanthine dehydrogenase family protein molybdopterin-binding subunit [Amycolatopsis sp. Hca4]QKV75808.1 xanthine dehydrogenase family protein [Amycolatopsis sp. Hca4]
MTTPVNPRISGQLRYSLDHRIPGSWHLRLVRSTVPAGTVTGIDTSFVGDDVLVITPGDIAAYPAYGCQIEDQHLLTGHPKFVGDPVAAVVAPTERAAREAATMIDVAYEETAAVFDEIDALAVDAPLVHATHATSDSDSAYFDMRPQDGTNVCHRFRIRTPALQGRDEPALVVAPPALAADPLADAFAEADVIVEETFHVPAAAHVPMEPHATTAQWVGERLEVTTGTQTPFNLRQDLARLFGLPTGQVRVIAPPMGGAFGAKTFVRTEAITALAARVCGRPVRCVLDRDEVFSELTRHAATVRMRIGARRDGTFVAKRMWSYVNTGAYADCGPGVAQKMGYAGVGPYRFDHVAVDSYCVYTNLPPGGAYRGYGAMQSVWASERLIDQLADELRMDAVELRRMNLLRDGDTFCTGEVMHDTHFEELLDDVAKAVAWQDGRAGKGVAVMLKGMQTPSKAEAEIHALPGGRYEVRSATADMGQGTGELLTRLAAELLDVPAEKILAPAPDTDRVPYDTRTTSSRSAHMMSRALAAAADDLRVHGTIGHGYIANEGGLDPDTGQGVASSHWHQGAAAAQVEVDEETGVIDIKTLYASSYAGRVINRAAAELQNEGSMIMALGSSLFEEIQYVDGQPANPNLSDYNIASALDCAAIRHRVLELPGAEVHGLGETAVPPVPPAIGNAVASLGYQPRILPMTPERVLAARQDPAEEEGER